MGGSLGSEAIIKSGGGNVHIDSITGGAKIGTGGGTVYVGSANTLLIDDDAGSIDVRRCFGNFRAKTGAVTSTSARWPDRFVSMPEQGVFV